MLIFSDYFIQPIPQAQRYFNPAQMAGIRPTPRWSQSRPQVPGQAGPFHMQGQFRPQQHRGGAPGAPNGQIGIRSMGRPMQGNFIFIILNPIYHYKIL